MRLLLTQTIPIPVESSQQASSFPTGLISLRVHGLSEDFFRQQSVPFLAELVSKSQQSPMQPRDSVVEVQDEYPPRCPSPSLSKKAPTPKKS